jgi:hypothetical protein
VARAKTKEETRDEFLRHIKYLVRYWAKASGPQTIEDRCDGVAFSILACIDGCTEVPAMTLRVNVHPSDRAYRRQAGENWHRQGIAINDDCELHEVYSQLKE